MKSINRTFDDARMKRSRINNADLVAPRRPRVRPAASAVTVVALLLSALVLTGASASPSVDHTEAAWVEALAIDVKEMTTIPNETVTVYGHEMSLARFADLIAIAEGEGITLERSIHKYGWEHKFAELANEVADTYPDDYAGAAITERGPWIAFKGGIPGPVSHRLDSIPIAIDVVEERGFSEGELTHYHERVFEQVANRSEVVRAFGSQDIAAGVVTIKVELKEGLRQEFAAELAAALHQIRSENTALSLVVEATNDLGEPLWRSHIRGGGHMRHPDHGAWCTFGFNVFRVGSTQTGISTAEHCSLHSPNNRQYHNPGSGTYTRLDLQARASRGHGDLAWYRRSGHAVHGSSFFRDNNQVVDVTTSYRAPVVGETLCRYGRATRNKCDKVRSLNNSFRMNNGFTYYKLALTENMTSDNGDSGGPWFSGSVAVGIHSASVKTCTLCKWRDVFTPVHPNLYDSMLVRVRTGNACVC
jgi:streptogrisin C